MFFGLILRNCNQKQMPFLEKVARPPCHRMTGRVAARELQPLTCYGSIIERIFIKSKHSNRDNLCYRRIKRCKERITGDFYGKADYYSTNSATMRQPL